MKPTPDEIDVWRAAQIMIQNYGDRAEEEAAYFADKAIEQGNPEGERAWVRIAKAVKELLSNAGNQPLH